MQLIQKEVGQKENKMDDNSNSKIITGVIQRRLNLILTKVLLKFELILQKNLSNQTARNCTEEKEGRTREEKIGRNQPETQILQTEVSLNRSPTTSSKSSQTIQIQPQGTKINSQKPPKQQQIQKKQLEKPKDQQQQEPEQQQQITQKKLVEKPEQTTKHSQPELQLRQKQHQPTQKELLEKQQQEKLKQILQQEEKEEQQQKQNSIDGKQQSKEKQLSPEHQDSVDQKDAALHSSKPPVPQYLQDQALKSIDLSRSSSTQPLLKRLREYETTPRKRKSKKQRRRQRMMEQANRQEHQLATNSKYGSTNYGSERISGAPIENEVGIQPGMVIGEVLRWGETLPGSRQVSSFQQQEQHPHQSFTNFDQPQPYHSRPNGYNQYRIPPPISHQYPGYPSDGHWNYPESECGFNHPHPNPHAINYYNDHHFAFLHHQSHLSLPHSSNIDPSSSFGLVAHPLSDSQKTSTGNLHLDNDADPHFPDDFNHHQLHHSRHYSS